MALCLVAATASLGAAPVPAAPAAPTDLCDLLGICGDDGESGGGGGDSGGGGSGGGGGLDDLPIVGDLLDGDESGEGDGSDAEGGIPPLPLVAKNDDSGTVFTRPASQLGGSSLEISGLKSVSLVKVKLEDGSRTTVIRLKADRIAINDFVLDVRKERGGDAGVTVSDRMVLDGHVVAYVDGISATLLSGTGINIGAKTPIPEDEFPSELRTVTLGLTGVISDRMTMTPSHLKVTAGEG
jgi:hypothetical protein